MGWGIYVDGVIYIYIYEAKCGGVEDQKKGPIVFSGSFNAKKRLFSCFLFRNNQKNALLPPISPHIFLLPFFCIAFTATRSGHLFLFVFGHLRYKKFVTHSSRFVKGIRLVLFGNRDKERWKNSPFLIVGKYARTKSAPENDGFPSGPPTPFD